MSQAVVSVIVRSLNKEETIAQVLVALRAQSVHIEIIVVDSGSTDSTVSIAERYADRVLRITQSEFSYGGALNRGAAVANAPFHFALSAHTVPTSRSWIERALVHYQRDDVAATNGSNDATRDPKGNPLKTTYFQTYEDSRLQPLWGFSNTASSWRREVWEQHPFDETLEACEDKEWSWRVLRAGWTIAYNPELSLSSAHRRVEGKRALYERSRKEQRVLSRVRDDLDPSAFESLHDWWSHFPYESSKPKMLRRLSPNRTIELIGRYCGAREGASQRQATQ